MDLLYIFQLAWHLQLCQVAPSDMQAVCSAASIPGIDS